MVIIIFTIYIYVIWNARSEYGSCLQEKIKLSQWRHKVFQTTINSMKLGKKVILPKRSRKKHAHLTLMIQLMTLSFYFTWTPYALYSIVTMTGLRLTFITKIVTLLFAKIGTVITPLLFISFRRTVRKLCRKYKY